MKLRDQTYKQELRNPESCNHPDERMQMTIQHPTLRISAAMVADPETGKIGKVAPKLSKDGA